MSFRGFHRRVGGNGQRSTPGNGRTRTPWEMPCSDPWHSSSRSAVPPHFFRRRVCQCPANGNSANRLEPPLKRGPLWRRQGGRATERGARPAENTQAHGDGRNRALHGRLRGNLNTKRRNCAIASELTWNMRAAVHHDVDCVAIVLGARLKWSLSFDGLFDVLPSTVNASNGLDTNLRVEDNCRALCPVNAGIHTDRPDTTRSVCHSPTCCPFFFVLRL